MSLQNIAILKNATPQQLEKAAAYNHSELFALNAITQGGEVQTRDGLTWAYRREPASVMVTFPCIKAEQARDHLDDMMNWFRSHNVKHAGCWSLDPPQTANLNVLLLARGFQPGWHPTWMALDLDKINTGHPTPANLKIFADNDISIQHIKDLPYANDGAVSIPLMKAHPDKAQRFIALLNGDIVAQASVLLTTGPYGTAGIYGVGVLPRVRNKGIGKAVTIAACLYAKEKGYRYAVLNATGDGKRIYEQIGFEWINDGHSWWIVNDRYITDPNSRKQVTIAEAIGLGDITLLNDMGKQFTPDELNMPLANRMTLLQIAAHCKQPASAEWLAQHGAAFTVLDAWDLGWKDRAAALLKAHPQEVNRQYGDFQTTLLHIAAERDDAALAELALQAKPDLTIKDAVYNGIALGWAQYLQRHDIARMIEEYQKNL